MFLCVRTEMMTNQKQGSATASGHDLEGIGPLSADLVYSHLNALNIHSHTAIITGALNHNFITIMFLLVLAHPGSQVAPL